MTRLREAYPDHSPQHAVLYHVGLFINISWHVEAVCLGRAELEKILPAKSLHALLNLKFTAWTHLIGRKTKILC